MKRSISYKQLMKMIDDGTAPHTIEYHEAYFFLLGDGHVELDGHNVDYWTFNPNAEGFQNATEDDPIYYEE